MVPHSDGIRQDDRESQIPVGLPDRAGSGNRQPIPGLDARKGARRIRLHQFLRGAASDYDEWARQGARGWSYGEVLPYFRRMEASSVGKDEDHGRNGPITIPTNKRPSDTAKAFLASCENLQCSRNTDFNSGRIDGVGFVPINVDGRWRHSTASPAKSRPSKPEVAQANDGPQGPFRRKVRGRGGGDFRGPDAADRSPQGDRAFGRSHQFGDPAAVVGSRAVRRTVGAFDRNRPSPARGRQEPPRSSECRLVLQDECCRQSQPRAHQPLEVCEVDGRLALHQVRAHSGSRNRSYAVRQDGSRTAGARPPIPIHELLTRSQ
jgi:GMC oxidoreductase